MDEWLIEHMEGVLWTIEIIWVGGVLLVFSLYFIMKYYFRRQEKLSADEKK